MANNSGFLPVIGKALNDLKTSANAAVKPTVDQLQSSPLALTLKGEFGKVLPKISSDLNAQNETYKHMTDASMKRRQGLNPTAQDLDNEKRGTQLVTSMVLGTIGGAPEDAAASKVAAPAEEEATQFVRRGGAAPIKKGQAGPPGYLAPKAPLKPPAEVPQYAYDNQATTQVPIKPEPIQAPAQPKIPYPDIPDQPVDVMGDRVAKHPLTGGNPVLVDLRDQAKKNPYYLEDQMKSRYVMDHYVPGETALEVEQNLPKKLKEETQRIQNIIGDDPVKAKISDLVSENDSNLAEKGFVPGATEKGESATASLFRDLRSQVSRGTNAIVPEEVGGRDLLQYKKALDDRLQSVYKKIDNGTTLTPEETAALTLRRTIDQKLTEMYPDTKLALQRQSGMIDARPGVADAAKAEESAGTKAAFESANAPKPPGLISKVLKNNVVRGTLATVGAGAIAGETASGGRDINAGIALAGEAGNDALNFLPRIGGKQSGQSSIDQQPGYNKGEHNQSISYQFPDVKPNDDGSWTLDQKTEPSGGYMSDAQRKQQEEGLNLVNPVDQAKYSQIEANYAHAQTLAQNAVGRKGDPVFDFMTSSGPSMTGTNLMLTQGLKSLPTGFMNVWKPGLDIKSYASDPKNPANMQSAMSAIAAQNDDFAIQYKRMMGRDPGEDLTIKPGNSVGQMQIKLNRQANFLKGWYKKYEDPFLATSTETGTTDAGANQTVSQAGPSYSAPQSGNVGFTHDNSGSYLPAITPNQ